MCVQLLSIDFDYYEFWYGDPKQVDYFIKAHSIKAKSKAIEDDNLAWSIGRYVMIGTSVVMSQAFSNSSNAKYPKEPQLAIQLDEELAQRRREEEVVEVVAGFLALAKAMADSNGLTGESASI